MISYNFDTIKSIPGVLSAGSDRSVSPIADPSVTIFLENDYRLISTKNILGQSLSLDRYNDDTEAFEPVYQAKIFHENNLLPSKPADSFQEFSQEGEVNLSQNEFVEKLTAITGTDLLQFLQQRHDGLAFQVLSNRFKM